MEHVAGPDPPDPGLTVTEARLREAIRGDSYAVLHQNLEVPIAELDIPLCRMVEMTDVRHPLDPDIQKLRGEFTNGYKRGGPAFYVALRSFKLEEVEVSDKDRSGWSEQWKIADRVFEERLKANPSLSKFSNKMFHVWDGNHRYKAWMPFIKEFHISDPKFHVPVRAILLNVTEENKHRLLHAMTDWNK